MNGKDLEKVTLNIVKEQFGNKINVINSRNAIYGLVDFDKSSLDKIEWYPKSVFTKTCNFIFEIGDGIVDQYYNKDFDYDKYFKNNRCFSLSINKFDFSIIVKIEDCISLKFVELAKVGINYSDIFTNDVFLWDSNDAVRQKLCLESFKIIFSRLVDDDKYVIQKTIDIGLVIIDVLEQMPIVACELVKKANFYRTRKSDEI